MRLENHWEIKCITEIDGVPCDHRKGAHILNYGPGYTGLVSIGPCVVQVGEMKPNFTHDHCACRGFSDGKRWMDGQRM
jgi:hypothetical protein